MQITAAEMARAAGVDPKRFRAALRSAGPAWHAEGGAWTVDKGSARHCEMETVLAQLTSGAERARPAGARGGGGRTASDEHYVIDLCDAALGIAALRQHRFDFLRGDPGACGEGARLPVDAWYAPRNLVVEYRERQHSEAVAFFDRRQTVSGIGRGEQRRSYDQRRRDVLAERGITLVEFDYSDFAHDGAKRLRRVAEDREVVARRLAGIRA